MRCDGEDLHQPGERPNKVLRDWPVWLIDDASQRDTISKNAARGGTRTHEPLLGRHPQLHNRKLQQTKIVDFLRIFADFFFFLSGGVCIISAKSVDGSVDDAEMRRARRKDL